MADTVRKTQMAAILAALNANRPEGIPEFRSRRLLPEAPVTDFTGSVYWNIERVQPKGGSRHAPLVNRSLRFVVEYRGVTSDPDEIDSMMEPLISWGTKQLVKEKPLGGAAIELSEDSTSWAPFFLEKYYPVVRHEFVVVFQTNKYDQEEID